MNYTALSLSQTPPLSVPLRFFLTAPLFLAAAALLLTFSGDALEHGRWSPTLLALTHLVTLGFLGITMVGAAQQILPVLIGTPVPSPRLVSSVLHLAMTGGITLLVSGMGLGRPALLQWGSALLLPALLLFILLAGLCLWRTSSRHATVSAMALALTGLLVLGSIALWLLNFGHWQVPLAHSFTRLHIGWGTLAWIGALLIGVAYQVVPMFQITPEYPQQMRRWLIPALALLLILWSLLYLFSPALSPLSGYLLALLFILFALQTLKLQQQRKRRLADVTLDFWRVAMGALILSAIAWTVSQWHLWPQWDLIVGALYLLGFAASAVNGMLYKIVPFLIWLHLNHRFQAQGSWQGGVPNMKQIIPVAVMRRQFKVHLIALVLLFITLIVPTLIPAWVAGGVWALSALMLFWNLLQALLLSRRVVRAMTQS